MIVCVTGPPPPARKQSYHATYLGDPTRLGDACAARSVGGDHLDHPIVLTSPRLSPRYRVPAFVPPSSCRGSAPPVVSPRSARLSRMQAPGWQLYDAATRGDVAVLQAMTARPRTLSETHSKTHSRARGATLGSLEKGPAPASMPPPEMMTSCSSPPARDQTLTTPDKSVVKSVVNSVVKSGRVQPTVGAPPAAHLSFVGPCFANSALDVAIKRHHTEAVRLLITSGAPVNSRDKFGNSPLHAACRLGDDEMVRLLLAAKADPIALNKKGLTPLQCALSSEQCLPPTLQALHQAAAERDASMYALL